ncbi:hypothetical protein [Halobacillus litoralis]|uniref:hypothetical protein n=1 Tax=Halobacillus litoralis TaxID=45668 RepID=UPI001CD6D6E1|nr:hypothetical protein [Halobacillus litoralis]MCA1021540.1 hypothetical protein [Halobacillus litoralis]
MEEFFEKLLERVNELRIDAADNLSIGDLHGELSKYNDDREIIIDDGTFFDGEFDSYRGYYQDLALGFEWKDQELNTVGSLKEMLEKALKIGGMHGYKGGNYRITPDTLVWLANYGSCGKMIVDLKEIEGRLILITKEDD